MLIKLLMSLFFEPVYCYFNSKNTDFKEDDEDYLFKNKIYCGKCRGKLNLKDNLFTCSNNCAIFIKQNLIESILDVIVDDAFKASDDGINKLKLNLSNEIKTMEDKISKLRIQKLSDTHMYLKNKNELYITQVTNIQKDINCHLRKIAFLRQT